jgi:hypothetical protein
VGAARHRFGTHHVRIKSIQSRVVQKLDSDSVQGSASCDNVGSEPIGWDEMQSDSVHILSVIYNDWFSGSSRWVEIEFQFRLEKKL